MVLRKIIFVVVIVAYLTSYDSSGHISTIHYNNHLMKFLKHDSTFSKKITLTEKDSVILHLYESKINPYFSFREITKTVSIFNENIKALFHIFISVYPDTIGYYSFGSTIIYYKTDISHNKYSKIIIDSIDVQIGARSVFLTDYKIVDINYDSYKDIVLSFTENTGGNSGSNIFLTYNNIKNQYITDSLLNKQFNKKMIYIDLEDSTISTGYASGSFGFDGEKYKWMTSKYSIFAKTETKDINNIVVAITKELINSNWQIVKRDTIYIHKSP